MIRTISFDMDGTLVGEEYDDLIWWDAIPKYYAKKHGISKEAAIAILKKEYYTIPEKGDWFSPKYWIERFGLGVGWKEMMMKYKDRIILYPDVRPALEELRRRGYRLVLTTTAAREFIEVKLEVAGLAGYFDHTFSASSDFARSKRGANIFARVARILRLRPDEILHVGNDPDFDHAKPRSIGMEAILIDRSGKAKEEGVIYSLDALLKKTGH